MLGRSPNSQADPKSLLLEHPRTLHQRKPRGHAQHQQDGGGRRKGRGEAFIILEVGGSETVSASNNLIWFYKFVHKRRIFFPLNPQKPVVGWLQSSWSTIVWGSYSALGTSPGDPVAVVSTPLTHPLTHPVRPVPLCLTVSPSWQQRALIKPDLTSSVQSSRSVVSDSVRPHGLRHARPPCPSPTPGAYSNSCPLSR